MPAPRTRLPVLYHIAAYFVSPAAPSYGIVSHILSFADILPLAPPNSVAFRVQTLGFITATQMPPVKPDLLIPPHRGHPIAYAPIATAWMLRRPAAYADVIVVLSVHCRPAALWNCFYRPQPIPTKYTKLLLPPYGSLPRPASSSSVRSHRPDGPG